MQTFITDSYIPLIATRLDNKRLNKQRVEAKQILLALSSPSYGWRNHPAVRMWKNHESYLACYGYHMCYEWKVLRRKRDDADLLGFFQSHIPQPWAAWWEHNGLLKYASVAFLDIPPRFVSVIESHRSNLIRKDPAHYRKFWPDTPDNLPYVWPNNVPLKDYAYTPEQSTQAFRELRTLRAS